MKCVIIRRTASALILLCLLFQESSADTKLHIYKTGTEFSLTATWWGLTANGTMEVVGKTKFRGKDTILVRSQVTELGGFLGFIVKFLRIYKESNTFDSYIDPDTLTPVRYEVYRLNKDGSKKLNEHIYFDRKLNRIVSLEDDSAILINAPPDTQDIFSSFLSLIRRFNAERLFVGKRFYMNVYMYKKISRVETEVTDITPVNGMPVYTLRIEKLPDIFKYPASIVFDVADVGGGFKFPTTGKCTINVPVLKGITVDGELREIKRAS